MADGVTRGPALGVLEVGTIARGVVVADAALKRAPAVLLSSRAVSGGKHLVMLEGGVAEVDEAMAAGKRVADKLLIDWVQLAYADDQVWPMLGAPVAAPDWSADPEAEAVAIIETQTVCGAITARRPSRSSRPARCALRSQPPTPRARSPRSTCATSGSRSISPARRTSR